MPPGNCQRIWSIRLVLNFLDGLTRTLFHHYKTNGIFCPEDCGDLRCHLPCGGEGIYVFEATLAATAGAATILSFAVSPLTVTKAVCIRSLGFKTDVATFGFPTLPALVFTNIQRPQESGQIPFECQVRPTHLRHPGKRLIWKGDDRFLPGPDDQELESESEDGEMRTPTRATDRPPASAATSAKRARFEE